MPQFIIDGKTYEFEGSPFLLQFCLDNKIEIPYFCYHPAMSVPTNCRMCLVDVGFPARDRASGETVMDEEGNPVINWGRKPATSCNTPVAPGMIVRTHRTSPDVKKMQEGVLEYMLANHPLDCPICDQAGECPLQIWTYKYGPEGSRFEVEKGHKNKRIELGPNVVLDAERCINCTRCTRFTEEVSGSWQLTIANRGEKNHPSTAPGEIFDDPYSMNTIDLCPVGALTSTDFRFKARVWEMSFNPGVCNGCSNGCNTDVWIRDNKVLRQTPRENTDVNQYWMCDAGRLDIAKYNENRVSGAKLKGDVPVELGSAYKRAAEVIKSAKDAGAHIGFFGSAYASTESNYALRQLARGIGLEKIEYITHIEAGWGDQFLRKDDRTPNAAGCEMLGFNATTIEAVRKQIKDGHIKYMVMLEDDKAMEALSADLDNVQVINFSQNYSPGHDKFEVVFPAASSIESECTYINAAGVPQATRMAREIRQMTPEMWMRLPKSRLDKSAVAVDRWRDVENIFDVLPSWMMLSRLSGELGKELNYRDHKDVFGRLKAEFEPLREMKISYKVPKEAFKSSQFDFAVK